MRRHGIAGAFPFKPLALFRKTIIVAAMLATARTCIMAAAGLLLMLAGSFSATAARASVITPVITPAITSSMQEDRHSAVIFVYHSIGDDDDLTANISAAQFQNHIKELQGGGYTILPLTKIVDDLKNESPLPPHTVALSFDGGHKSIMAAAVPLLLKENIPFTVFIAPGQLDQNLPDYINWDDAKQLAKNKLVTIGMHPDDYKRLSALPPTEIAREVNTAKARFREQLGVEPTLFAYPFGEYSIAYRSIVEQNGFTAAFGQQSGVAWSGSDIFALPRFSMTESYGDIDRFRMIADALPLPVTGVEPQDPRLTTASPAIGFTVDPRLKRQLRRLACFVSDQERPTVHIIGDSRVELRMKQPLTAVRVRINCTLPVPPAPGDDTPRWRWFGLLLTNPSAP
jgi:peptidoglycan/xylan/chitin deacetylase (PgdA/CDA1 family)